MADHITRPEDRTLPDGSAPHFMVSWGQAEDGSFFAQIRLVGLNTKQMAIAATQVLERRFCGDELNGH